MIGYWVALSVVILGIVFVSAYIVTGSAKEAAGNIIVSAVVVAALALALSVDWAEPIRCGGSYVC